MTVTSPAMGIEIDSRTATTKEHVLSGRSYYLETMGLAVPGPLETGDLGLMKMKAPTRVVLKSAPVAKTVSVRLQNHGARTEVVPDRTALEQLVTVEVESLGACAAPVASLRSPAEFPLTLPPRKTRTIAFAVTFDCANDPLATKGTGAHWDYRWVARLHAVADADAHDDVCPHDAPPGRVDPVDTRVKDRGCGGKKAGKLRGADVFTDVVAK